MKEIKFRAWDKINNRLSYEICEIDFNDRTVSYRYSIRPDGCGLFSNREMKDIILEQYTGLKDKNGKEIYEGDILNGRDGLNQPIQGEIEMVIEWGRWILKPNLTLTDGVARRCKIIGNIHENPELLKE